MNATYTLRWILNKLKEPLLERLFFDGKNKKARQSKDCLALSMDYKKDIFAVFAYEFELLHK